MKSSTFEPGLNLKTLCLHIYFVRLFFVMCNQATGHGTYEIWDVCPFKRPLLKLEKEKYQLSESASSSALQNIVKNDSLVHRLKSKVKRV